MKLLRLVGVECERAWKSGALCIVLIAYVLYTLYAVFVGGALTCTSDGSVITGGFFVSPDFQPQMLDEVALTHVVPLAHAQFFPVIALLVIAYLSRNRLWSGAAFVSYSRGANELELLIARIAGAELLLLVPYTVYSLLLACAEPLLFGVAIISGVWRLFFPKLLQTLVACFAFIVLAETVVSIFGNGEYVLGLLLVVTFMGEALYFWTGQFFVSPTTFLIVACGPMPGDEIVPAFTLQLIGFMAVSVAASMVCARVVAAYRIYRQ